MRSLLASFGEIREVANRIGAMFTQKLIQIGKALRPALRGEEWRTRRRAIRGFFPHRASPISEVKIPVLIVS
jgi:hypothetical protein